MLINTVAVKLRYERIIQDILESERNNLSFSAREIIANTKIVPVKQVLAETSLPVKQSLTGTTI